LPAGGAPDQAAILAEIAARSTAGLDHLNALLTSGALPRGSATATCWPPARSAASLSSGGHAGARQAAVGRRQTLRTSRPRDSPPRSGCPAGTNADSAADTTARPDWPLNQACDLGPIAIIRGTRRLTALLPPGSVHLIITSPPYNVGVGYRSHDDALADDE
jgi:hypothetical protein